MRILFVVENYYPHIGGVEVVFKNLAEGLAKRGHKVDVVTHRLKGTKKLEKINGVTVRRVSCFRSRYWFTFLSIPQVLKLAKKTDIIHTTTFNGAPPAWLASKIRKKPCIITVHEVWVNKWQKLTDIGGISAFMHNVLEKMIYKLSYNHYVCVSKATQNDLVKIGIKKEKTSVAYNAVDYGHFDPKKHDSKKIRSKLGINKNFVVLSYGRPGVSKGIGYVIKAFPEIADKIPQAVLLLILSKDRQYRKRYEYLMKLIKNSKAKNQIIVHNPVPWKELPAYLKAADCVVVPSLSEGFGYTAAEACAMEKPVVVTSAGSLPEVVSGKYAIIKPKSHSGIAKGVFAVYKGKVKNTEKKKFLLNDNINRYLEVYKSVK